jgi:hypothetical protein
MKSLRRASFLWLALLTIVAAPARATVPSTTSYQGVLTDNSGNLVADGPYNLVFRMYDVASGGLALWTETQSGVQVSKGGFAVILGSITPLNLPFDKQYYLGVTVNAGPELTPRVIVAGSPQALSLRLPFAATESSAAPLLSITNTGSGPAIVGTPSITAGSPTSIGSIGVTGPGAGGMTGWIFETSVGAELRLYSPTGTPFAGIMPWGPSYTWGRMYLSGASGFAGMAVEANNSATEDPNLLLQGVTNSMYLDMSQIGDASIQLPASAISAYEIADEPGIAQGHVDGGVGIPANGFPGPVADLVSVQITTPSAGYVVVEADGMHGIGGDGTNTNQASFTIKDTPGGGIDTNHWFVSGFMSNTPNTLVRLATSMRRTYYVGTGGTYTYYFQATADNPLGSLDYIWDPTITATYHPTSYGSVALVASGPEAARDGLTGRTVSASMGPGGERYSADAVTVDLRDLELRAAKLRADAEAAQRRLLEARMKESTAPGRVAPAKLSGRK